MTKRNKGISTKETIISLVIARISDVIIAGLSLLIALVFMANIPEKVARPMKMIILAITLLILILFIFAKQKNRVQNVIFKLLMFFKKLMPKKIADKITKTDDLFSFKMSIKESLLVVLYSALIWLSGYTSFWVIFKQVIPGISFGMVVIGGAIWNFSILLLIQGVAGFGTTEGVWSIVLVLFGINEKLAISGSFVVHIVQVSLFVTFGIYGIFSKTIKTKEKGFVLTRDYKND